MPSSKHKAKIETVRGILKSDRKGTLTSADLDELNKIRAKDGKKATKLTNGSIIWDARRHALESLRLWLVDSIEKGDLSWGTLNLKMGQRTPGTAPYRVQVCQPVQIFGFFVPVTAKETWDLAVKLGGPHGFHLVSLTRAVFDQYFNSALDQSRQADTNAVLKSFKGSMSPNRYLPDFELFSSVLESQTNYHTDSGNGKILAGVHKLWPLSANATKAKPVNYGLYHPGHTPAQGRHGSYLYRGQTTINGLIRAHDWHAHWDYSQLLQFMQTLQDDGNHTYNLRKVLQQLSLSPKEKAALKAVWDEPYKPAKLSWYNNII